MAKAVIMPKAGITVESCIIGEWKKKIGDAVKVGDILFDYETDKAAFECESTEEGELLEIFFENGEEVPVLVNVCAIGTKGEDTSSLRPEGAEPAAAPAAEAAPAAAPAAGAVEAPVAEAPAATVNTDGIVKISPRARELATRAGVNAALATPTGPKGRIVEKDVRELMKNPVVETVAPATATAKAPEVEYEDVKFSGIRRTIAKSMIDSLSGMAQLTNSHSFDATSIQRCRKEFKDAGGELAGVTLGDMVLFAVARTLKNHPELNANIVTDEKGNLVLRKFTHVHLGVAVDTPRGLMVPTIFNADTKSITEISKELKELAAAARSGSISPDLLRGGSFTVSNLGAFGVESFTPVINPPQVAILGVCSIVDRVRKTAGGLEVYPAMGLSLTYDHRSVDGAPAARFAKELCENLEKFTATLLK